jgi:adenylate/nucleoside-diphosphate kinase
MKLQEQYGWRVVDYPKLVRSRIEAILAEDGHLPNNVVPGKSKIGLSQSEIDEIKTGKPFPAWKFIPWILDHLGYPLAEKPDPPPAAEEEVDPETLDEDAKAEYMKQKKIKEQKEAKAAAEAAKVAKEKEEYKAKRAAAIAAGEDLEALGLSAPADDEPVTEDLSIDKLVLKPEADGKNPFVGGFILLGFPQTETHALKLKEHGVGFDRILYLMDPSEEEPGKEVKARMAGQSLHYDWDAELEKAGRIIGVAREHLKQGGGEEGEEGVDVTREINATGSIDEVAVRIRLEIDPFADRCDNPDDVRDPPDPADEEAKRLPIGDFGDYCPVTYVKEGFLLKGSAEQEVQVFGKTYRLAGENEANEFKANPSKYLAAASVLPIPPPAPKIMIMGMKGSGVTTQIQKLCSKYKLEELSLKDEFLAKMKSEKEARQRRRLLERGFRPPAPADEETGVVPPDPEIEDDPEDFEKEAHERELLKLICNKDKGLIVDGTWSGFPEETVAAVDPAGFANLLYESRRAPELVVILRCEEATAFHRMIDAEATKAKYEQAMKDLTEGVATAKEAERVTKLEEVTKELTEAGAGEDPPKAPEEVEKEIKEAMEAWNAEKDEADAAALEAMEYPEKPDLEEMMKEHKEKITAQQEADKEFFGDADGGLISELAQKGIPVIDDIRADTSAEFVFLKLIDRLKAHF